MALIRVVKGQKGDKGDKGDPGADGKDGIDGRNGIDGKNGRDGIDGKNGKDGKDGVTQTIIDTQSLAKLQEQYDKLFEEFRKLKARKPEQVYIGGGSGASNVEEIVVTFDGGGSVLSTGDTHTYYTVPYDGNLSAWYLTGDPSGSMSVDVWKAASGIIPNSSAFSVAGSDLPTIVSGTWAARKSLNTSIWKTPVSAGDIFGFSISSVSTITKAILTLKVTV